MFEFEMETLNIPSTFYKFNNQFLGRNWKT